MLHQVFCLLLCLSAWRGPVPVLHDHGWLGSSEQLNKHQQRFHDDGCCEICAGLHWHLAFPEDVTGRELPERDQTAPELAVFACAAASLPSDAAANEIVFAFDHGPGLGCVVTDIVLPLTWRTIKPDVNDKIYIRLHPDATKNNKSDRVR